MYVARYVLYYALYVFFCVLQERSFTWFFTFSSQTQNHKHKSINWINYYWLQNTLWTLFHCNWIKNVIYVHVRIIIIFCTNRNQKRKFSVRLIRSNSKNTMSLKVENVWTKRKLLSSSAWKALVSSFSRSFWVYFI